MVCSIVYADSDVMWVQGVLDMLVDGGTWACPCTTSLFKFNKKRKEYELVGDKDDPTNIITITILEKELGYKRKE